MNDNNFNDNFPQHECQVDLLAKAKLKPIQQQKRFYKAVELKDGVILLDGMALKTPARNALVITQPLIAQSVADEWAAQEIYINPNKMPISKLVFTAIDAVADQRDAVIAECIRYAKTDLIFYHAHEPEGLVIRQSAAWTPVLVWAAQSLNLQFETSTSLQYIEQPEASLTRLHAYLSVLSDLALTAHHACTTLLGSNLLALALKEKFLSPQQAWDAAHVDELWNREKWGIDDEDEAVRAENFALLTAIAKVVY